MLAGVHSRVFRNRHGRGLRGPLTPNTIPRYRTRAQAFDMAVLEAYAPIHSLFPRELEGLDIAVDTVPRMRLRSDMTVLPDDIIADGPVPLGRMLPAGVDATGNPTRARIVVFRQSIQQRSANAEEQQNLLTTVVTYLVAYYLNIDPRDIDPDFTL